MEFEQSILAALLTLSGCADPYNLSHSVLCRVFSATGDLLIRALRRTRAAGWFAAEAMWSVLWLAVTAPGGYVASVLVLSQSLGHR